MSGNYPFPRRPRGRFPFFAVPVAIAVGTALGGVVMLLWNNLLPELFGFRKISFWQALGLLALCRILFGNFGGGRGYGRDGMRRRGQIMREKWNNMTDEERNAFKEEWKRRCGR